MSRLIRSPSFPFISLREAVERARLLYDAVRRSPASVEAAVETWGYSSKSSGGKQTVAALRAFGLLDGEGSVRLTDRAVHILLNDESAERDRLVRQAALSPAVYARLWERYGPDLPSDSGLRTHLVLEMGFNENAVGDVIRGYKETLDFAKMRESPVQAPAPLPPADLFPDLGLSFPLLNNNRVDFRVLRKIDPAEAEQVRTLFAIWLEKITGR